MKIPTQARGGLSGGTDSGTSNSFEYKFPSGLLLDGQGNLRRPFYSDVLQDFTE